MISRRIFVTTSLSAFSLPRSVLASEADELQSALNRYGVAKISTGSRIVISQPLIMPAGSLLLGDGTIAAAPGYKYTHLVRMHDHACINGSIKFDGRSMSYPVNPGDRWTSPPPSCGIYINGIESPASNQSIIGVEFYRFSSSALVAIGASDLTIKNCRAIEMQQNTNEETFAVFQLQLCRNMLLSDCEIDNFRWKGFAFISCHNSHGVRCSTKNGQPGQASHYIRWGLECGYEGGGASGPGYGLKSFNSANGYAKGMKFENVDGGVFVDSTDNFECSNINIINPRNQGIMLQSEAGFQALSRINIVNCKVEYSNITDNMYQCGLALNAQPLSPIMYVNVDRLDVRGAFWGIGSITGPDRYYSNIQVRNSRLLECVQYGMVMPLLAGEFIDNDITFRGDNAQAGVQFWIPEGMPNGGKLVITGNKFSTSKEKSIQLSMLSEPSSYSLTQDNNSFDSK